MSRREFTKAVYNQIMKRALDPKLGLVCEGCGLVLGKKAWHVDHTVADGLHVDKSTPLTADDGKLLGVECCHKPKTANDVRIIAKAKRNEAKHLGLKEKKPWSPFKKKMNGQVVDRKTGKEIGK